MAEGAAIVVVDDSHDTRVALRETLEDEGYHVATACTGREGLAVLRSLRRPALALVDIMMPIMDGAELMRAVRADSELADLPLVLISAFQPEPSLLALADGYLRKPLARDSLLALVQRFCRPPRVTDA